MERQTTIPDTNNINRMTKIKTKKDVYIDNYLDSFDVEKKEEKNGVSYYLKNS